MKRSPVKPGSTPIKRTAFARAVRIENREIAKVSIKEKKLRTRKCAVKACRKEFAPRSMTHKTCSPECAQEYARIEKARTNRKERQEGLRKLMRKADHVAECQKAFNAWVRFRDRDQPCIDCGKFGGAGALTGGKWDAGHFLSRGSHPHLRFDERNVFKQLKSCNRAGGTTAASFELGVERRIGRPALDALKSDYEPRHYTVDQLIAMTAHYKKKLKDLKAAAA